MSGQNPCAYCGGAVEHDHESDVFSCFRCGRYRREGELVTALHWTSSDNLLAHVKQPDFAGELSVVIHDANVRGEIPMLSRQQLLAVRPLSVNERVDRLLLRVGQSTKRAGEDVRVPWKEPWRFGAYDTNDIRGLVEILEEAGTSRFRRSSDSAGDFDFMVALTAKGLDRFDVLSRGTDSSQAFVAMWFDKSMDSIYDQAIEFAISAAGYSPYRVDKKDDNGRIDARIEVEIKRSAFMVADMTAVLPTARRVKGRKYGVLGVYYEAGFAQGLGKKVIWTVRADCLPDLHFDTRQFNHIVWKPDDVAKFREALTARIQYTIGQGPVPVAPAAPSDADKTS